MLMLISYFVIKCLRYTALSRRGRQIIKTHGSRQCTYLIDQLQAYIHVQIDPEKGQTSGPLVLFLPGR